MRKFSCDEARAHLSDALAAEISRPDANVLEAHLLECDPCRSLSELFLWQDRVLAELAGQARIETLMSKVRAGLQNLDQVPVDEEARPRWSLPSFSPKWIAAAAAFALALAAVLFWKPHVQDNSTAQNVTPPPRVEVAPAPEPSPTRTVEKTPETEAQPAPELPAPPKSEVVREEKKVPPPQPPPKAPSELVASKVDTTPNPNAPTPPMVVKNVGKEVVMAQPKPKSLDEAVRDGMAFVKAKAPLFAIEGKADELVLWTYVHGGLPENDPQFQALLKGVLEKPLERTYNVALTAMVLEQLDRVKYQNRIAQCAQYLVDNQCGNGQWGYGDPSIFVMDLVLPPPPKKGVRKVPVTRKRDGPAAGDNSNSQYAVLGLRACHDAGIVLPASTIELAAKWWRESQSRVTSVKAPALAPEGWCYGKHEHKPYGSMTVGGIASLAICDYIQGKDAKKDREIANGMEWLAKNFSVAYNPGPYEHARFEVDSQHSYLYYMYGLERAAILYGTEQIGSQFWFAKGMQVLIEQQRPDGSWKVAGGNELHDTCFAILFLRKATRALQDVPTPGAGSVPKK
jgi:hypothetical protein